jgi:hypothetical protein
MPERIQRKRTRGWRKPDGAVVVSRPSKWGNPWRVVEHPMGWGIQHERSTALIAAWPTRHGAAAQAVSFYCRALQTGQLEVVPLEVTRELAGRDLACWCPLDQPCHADVLLEIANQGATDA